jgi:hypothetical protein
MGLASATKIRLLYCKRLSASGSEALWPRARFHAHTFARLLVQPRDDPTKLLVRVTLGVRSIPVRGSGPAALIDIDGRKKKRDRVCSPAPTEKLPPGDKILLHGRSSEVRDTTLEVAVARQRLCRMRRDGQVGRGNDRHARNPRPRTDRLQRALRAST